VRLAWLVTIEVCYNEGGWGMVGGGRVAVARRAAAGALAGRAPGKAHKANFGFSCVPLLAHACLNLLAARTYTGLDHSSQRRERRVEAPSTHKERPAFPPSFFVGNFPAGLTLPKPP
jgi:hypothetical protein